MKIASVIILNWNGKKYLEEFLPTLILHTPEWARIVVADNGSTDDSLNFLCSEYPAVKIISFEKNYGFAEGYNRAMGGIETKYSVLINSDVEVRGGWLEPLIELLESDKNIAAVMPKVLSFNERDKFEYAGACGGFIDRLGYPFCRGRILDTVEKDHGQYDEIMEVFWATGACFAVRTRYFNETGGFDPLFFAHQEEIDLCWRLKLTGYKIFVEPSSVVYHVGGGTLSSESPHKLFLNFRNNLAMLYKNLPKSKLGLILFIRMILDGFTAIVYLFHGNPKNFTAVFRAHIDFYRMLPELRRKRRQIQKTKLRKEATLIYRGSILFQYYSGLKTFSALKNKFK